MHLKIDFRLRLENLSHAIDYVLSMDDFGQLDERSPLLSALSSVCSALCGRSIRDFLKP